MSSTGSVLNFGENTDKAGRGGVAVRVVLGDQAAPGEGLAAPVGLSPLLLAPARVVEHVSLHQYAALEELSRLVESGERLAAGEGDWLLLLVREEAEGEGPPPILVLHLELGVPVSSPKNCALNHKKAERDLFLNKFRIVLRSNFCCCMFFHQNLCLLSISKYLHIYII